MMQTAKNGIMFKTAVSLENAGKTEIVALDKTGTITSGEPKVTDLYPIAPVTEKALLLAAGALEQKSEHPLAEAVVEYAESFQLTIPEIVDFKATFGRGVEGALAADFHAEKVAKKDGPTAVFYAGKRDSTADVPENSGKIAEQNPATGIARSDADSVTFPADTKFYVGNLAFLQEKNIILPQGAAEGLNRMADEGMTPLLVAQEGRFLGVIGVSDTVKATSYEAINAWEKMGVRVIMLTGDNRRTAEAIRARLSIERAVAEVLPQDKEREVRALQEQGRRVAMVGDGINDAPALTRADIGVAIGAGTDVAIDAADVVLMKSRLSDVPAAIRLSRATLRNIHENLFWAFFYNVVGIPLAAGAWISLLGWKMSPMFGAAAMSLSSFCVVSNALRLNFFDLRSAKKDKKIRPIGLEQIESEKENGTMTKTLNVEGMMCGHCEARVKKALEAVEGVASAEVSHEKGTAVVTLSKDVPDAVLKKAVEDQDYVVTAIE